MSGEAWPSPDMVISRILMHHGALRRGGHPAAQQGVKQDRTEGRRANPANRKPAQRQGKIARAQHQRDRHHNQVAVLAEIDPMLHPDARAGYGDQPKHHNRCPADDRGRNGVDQRAELR